MSNQSPHLLRHPLCTDFAKPLMILLLSGFLNGELQCKWTARFYP